MSGIPRGVLVVLAVSLALNLFFVGVWTGRHFAHRPHGPAGDVLGVRGFLRRSGLEEVSPEVKKIIHARRDAIRDCVRALGKAREGVRRVLEARPFDPGALDTALREVEARNDALQRAMHGALADVARVVDPEQRERMASALWPRGRGPR